MTETVICFYGIIIVQLIFQLMLLSRLDTIELMLKNKKRQQNRNKLEAYNEVQTIITKILQTPCNIKDCNDSDKCCETNALMNISDNIEKLKKELK